MCPMLAHRFTGSVSPREAESGERREPDPVKTQNQDQDQRLAAAAAHVLWPRPQGPGPGQGAGRRAARVRCPQRGSSQFPGVLVGTPHVRKCHQMSSKEHVQLGWVVRWVLSTPLGHPAARRCVRVVSVLPLLLCTRPARARPSVGGQSPTAQLPLRASSRGVLPGPGALAG
jgi:hypothetical protein